MAPGKEDKVVDMLSVPADQVNSSRVDNVGDILPEDGANPSRGDNAATILPVEEADLSRKAKLVKTLPNEILDNIFLQFDTPAPSDFKLKDQPTFDLTFSPDKHLKSSSLVCQKWRQVALPILFKHMCLLIRDPVMPKPIMRNEYFAMVDFVRRNKLKTFIKGFALCIANVPFQPRWDTHIELRKDNDFVSFWNKVLEVLNPLEIKIVCSPIILGALTGCHIRIDNYENFGGPYHYLQLRRPLVPPPQEPLPEKPFGHDIDPHPSVLFESRPWTTLLLNEGSFIQAYKLPEFHSKQPSSILEDLVKGDGFSPIYSAMIPPTVRDFSYIAMFPPSGHFFKLTQCCPRLDRLYTQFVPRNDTWKEEVAKDMWLDENDLWLERNSCYAYVMRELFSSPPSGNYCFLKEFESGDAADVDAWEMAVEYVKRAGGGWKVEKPGVFVKDMELAAKQDKNATDPESGEGHAPSLLSVPQGQE